MENAPDVWFPHLGIEIQSISKIAFRIFKLEVHWYGLLIVLGIILATFFVTNEAKRTGQDPDNYFDMLYYGLAPCLIGTRLYYVIFSWEYYKDNLLKIFAVWEGGLAIYGGIITAFIVAIIFTRKKDISFALFADTGVSGLLIGQAIGRWGNLINREAFGGYTDSLFAMRYIRDTVDSSLITPDIMNHIINSRGAEYIQVHPTFLYESLWNISLLILITLYKRHKKADGEIMLIYLGGYGLGRFWIEQLRVDQLKFFSTGLAVSQLLSALVAVSCAVAFIYIRIKQNRITKEANL